MFSNNLKPATDLPEMCDVPTFSKRYGFSTKKGYEIAKSPDFPRYVHGKRIFVVVAKLPAWLDAQVAKANGAKSRKMG